MSNTLSSQDIVSSDQQVSQQSAVTQESPPKRRPGRPKGSGKKQLLESSPRPKRPVGRPRRDGLPAGSVGPHRASRPSGRPPGRPRKSAPGKLEDPSSEPSASAPPPTFVAVCLATFISISSNFVPQHQYYPPPAGAIPPRYAYPSGPVHITAPPVVVAPPNPTDSDWASLAKTSPPILLQSLVSALAFSDPSTAGPGLTEAFKSHVASLPPKVAVRPGMPVPSYYSSLKSFWLPVTSSFFLLTTSSSSTRVLSNYRFLYWDPQSLLFNGIACPNCAAPLANEGHIQSGAMKVHDLQNPFYIIGCEYSCKSDVCISAATPNGRHFASTDSAILRSLPQNLQDEFPAHLVDTPGDSRIEYNMWNWQVCFYQAFVSAILLTITILGNGCISTALEHGQRMYSRRPWQGCYRPDHKNHSDRCGCPHSRCGRERKPRRGTFTAAAAAGLSLPSRGKRCKYITLFTAVKPLTITCMQFAPPYHGWAANPASASAGPSAPPAAPTITPDFSQHSYGFMDVVVGQPPYPPFAYFAQQPAAGPSNPAAPTDTGDKKAQKRARLSDDESKDDLDPGKRTRHWYAFPRLIPDALSDIIVVTQLQMRQTGVQRQRRPCLLC